MMHRLRDLLWLDAAAGLTVGVLTLALYRWAEPLYGLPDGALAAIGAANLGYGLFSLSLARRARRPMGRIVALVAANALWAGLCTVALVAWWGTAGALGLLHLGAEAAFVGGLAAAEWRRRDALRAPAGSVRAGGGAAGQGSSLVPRGGPD